MANLKDIATTQGVETLAQNLGQPSDARVLEQIRAIVSKVISKHPELGKTTVEARPGLNNAFYNFDNKKITTGMLDPDVMAHELGHVENTANSPAYQILLRSVRGLASLNGTLAIPAMLGMHAFMGNAARKDAVRTLAGVSSMMAGPILTEELSASANAVMNSDDKIRTLKRVLPAFGAHSVSSLLPSILYQIDARL